MVYLIFIEVEYEGREVRGVYSTSEKAEKAALKYLKERSWPPSDRWSRTSERSWVYKDHHLYIEEWEVK